MSDNENQTQDTPPEDKPKEEAKGLRKQLEDALAREKKLRATILEDAYEGLGLDPTMGLGKAIAKEYTGEASAKALAEYAKDEYGYTPPEAQPEEHPAAQQIASAQASLDQVGEGAGSIAPPAQQDAIAKAEADGNYDASIAMKSGVIGQMLRPGQ